MKNKKVLKVLSSALLLSASCATICTLGGCKKDNNGTTPNNPTSQIESSSKGTTPVQGGSTTSSQTTPVGPTTTSSQTTPAGSTSTSSAPQQEYVVTFDVEGDITTVQTNKGIVSEPANPSKSSETVNHKVTSYIFDGWYLGTQKFDFSTLITENITLTAKFIENKTIEEGYEVIQSSWVLDGTGLENGKNENAISNKGFTLDKGIATRSRAKTWNKTDYTSNGFENIDQYTMNDEKTSLSFTWSVKLEQSRGITFNALGDGICKFYAQNGSSGAGNSVNILIKNLTDETEEIIAIPATIASNPVCQVSFEIQEGKEYQILRKDSGTIDVFAIETDVIAPISNEVGVTIVSEGTKSFFAGSLFDTTGLNVSAVKDNDALISLDSSAYKVELYDSNDNKVDTSSAITTAGEYTVKVIYKEFNAATYKVNFYALDGIVLGFNQTQQGANNGYNGTYINHTVQQVYGINDTFDADGLSVYGVSIDEILKQKFDVNSNYISISTIDFTTPGEKEVVVKLNLNGIEKQETFNIYVVDTAVSSEKDGDTITNVNIYVDPSYEGTIGGVTNLNLVGKECNTFTTIQQALDYLGMQDGLESATKTVYLAAATYNEKLEITLPGLKLIGLEGKEKTVIEWDSVYGIADEGGYSQVTDSTATVAVRKEASNVTIKGVTISNYYNHISKYDKVGYGSSGERGLALLVQSDMFIMEDGSLLGWQDTLETFTGRQYFKNCYICGCVDFIFGTNSTTYFEKCEIEALLAKPSNAKEDNVCAYVTAYKGINSSGTTIKYGAIFNECDFTTADDFIGLVAIARPWADTSTVAVLNSTFGDKYVNKESKTIGTGLIKDNNVSTLQIKFYNNTYKLSGEAFTLVDDLTNVDTTLTVEEAANYVDFAKIFGASNGNVSYNLAWNPESTEIAIDKNIYYNFNDSKESTGQNYTFGPVSGNNDDGKILNGTSYALQDLTIDCTNGNAAFNANSGMTNFKEGVVLKISVKAGSSVKIKAYSANYANFLMNGYGTSTDTLIHYFAEDTDIEIVITGDTYISQIVVNPEAEETNLTLSSISLSGTPANDYKVGEELDLSNLVVKAIYSDNSYKVVDSTDYTIDTTNVNINEVGTYTVKVTYDGKEKTFDVKYVSAISDSFDEDSIIDFSSTSALTSSLANNKITYAEGFTYNDHTDSIQLQSATSYFSFKVKAGAYVTVTSFGGGYGYLLINNVSNNSDTTYSFVAEEDMTVTISIDISQGNNKSYLKKIEIKYGYITKTTGFNFKGGSYSGTNVIDCNSENENAYKITSTDLTSINGVTFEGVKSNGNDNWLAVIASGKITLNVTGPCTLNICFYNGQNCVKVSNNNTEISTDVTSGDYTTKYSYEISEAGEIQIEATSSGYIGYFEIVYSE